MEWISVKDRLPEDFKDVLMINRNGKMATGSVLRRDDGLRWSFQGRSVHESMIDVVGMPRVTHWMPLPPPPAKD